MCVDRGPQVTVNWGDGISSYEWVYVIPPERLPALREVAGVAPDTDPLEAVAQLYMRVRGRLYQPLTDPPVSAIFDNWRS
jgi:hypothetical protein